MTARLNDNAEKNTAPTLEAGGKICHSTAQHSEAFGMLHLVHTVAMDVMAGKAGPPSSSRHEHEKVVGST